MASGEKAFSGVIAAFLCVAALVFIPSPASASSAAASYETAAVKSTNGERVKRDLKALKAAKCVDKYADKWAKHMAKKQKMYHQPLRPILKKCKLHSVGENIAVGFRSGEQVVAAWMNSPGHKENILRGKYRQIGLGAFEDDNGRWWVSQVFGQAK